MYRCLSVSVVCIYTSQRALMYVDALTTPAMSEMKPPGVLKLNHHANVSYFLLNLVKSNFSLIN